LTRTPETSGTSGVRPEAKGGRMTPRRSVSNIRPPRTIRAGLRSTILITMRRGSWRSTLARSMRDCLTSRRSACARSTRAKSTGRVSPAAARTSASLR